MGWLKMETGVKAAHSTFTNEVRVEMLQNAGWKADPELTGTYHLAENIAAVYTAWDVQANKKTSLKLGLRYEHTVSRLGSAEQPDLLDRNYGNWFPSLFASHLFNDQDAVNFSYSRRITRPTLNEMAPFIIFIDPNMFFSGNAALQPAISNNLSLNYRHNSILFTLQYSKEDSAMARFQSRFEPARNGKSWCRKT